MIASMGYRPAADPPAASGHAFPWQDPGPARNAVFVVLGVSGADPRVDGLFRLQAQRRGPDGSFEEFDRRCDPFPACEGGSATRRMAQESGRDLTDRGQPPPAAELSQAFFEFLGPGPTIVLDSQAAAAWLAWLAAGRQAVPAVLGIEEIAGLLLPGREGLVPGSAEAPHELERALAQVVEEFLALPEPVIELAAAGLASAWRRFDSTDAPLASRLGACLAVVEHPSAWALDPAELFAAHTSLRDGRLSVAARFAGSRRDPAERSRELIDTLEPRSAADGRLWAAFDAVPVDARGELAPLEVDRRVLDEIFEVHLPALSAARSGGVFSYRAGQHEAAREIARTLGAKELLLVSAPTGTGKTLSYRLPALLWAARNQVRVGISTYTRALQEQAAMREVPRALAALARCGLVERPRVSLLKGRVNYVCWRALRAQVPGDGESAETWLAWTMLALFALRDEDGDLDRLPVRFPLAASGPTTARERGATSRCQRELEALVRVARAQSSCCTHGDDRQTCAAEVARLRAERSHVVLTNHALALLRQSFFKHVIFDECEHLHDQAHTAWSHSLTIGEFSELLARLRAPRRSAPPSPPRALLDRLARVVPPRTEARTCLESCHEAWGLCDEALAMLERTLSGFKAWRELARRTCHERDEHALLRQFVERSGEIPEALQLIEARRALGLAGNELEGRLAELVTHLDSVPARGVARLRRALELARSDLAERLASLEAWLPIEDGRPAFRPETFHDVETDARGEDALIARVLLPNEFLGRRYYPQLGSAVLISATTWLRGGFESSAAYLGLDRAAAPAPGEEREPCRVRTFRAPEVFDYRRVLVCVPGDAPDVREREPWLAFARRFVSYLGERTRGRMLVLFTNAEDARRSGEALDGFFRARRIPLWWQGMAGVAKEELPALFRARKDSVLFGLDTFWFGADFPGETLEYVVIARLPYGVPDRYHHAQCAALGTGEQRRRIYMPRALGKLRQGFGRLMRREEDRGCVFVLDRRILEPRHRAFLRELPIERGALAPDEPWIGSGAHLAVGSADEVVHAALSHMGLLDDVRRRGLEQPFGGAPADEAMQEPAPDGRRRIEPEYVDIPPEDLPF